MIDNMPSCIAITPAEAVALFDDSPITLPHDVVKMYNQLLTLFESKYPADIDSPNFIVSCCLAAIWNAGRVQGIATREILGKRIRSRLDVNRIERELLSAE